MRIYYINANNGDGSSRTEFYDNKECIDFCCDEDNDMEDYWDGDGGSYGSFEVPDGTPITGITIGTIETLKAAKAEADEWKTEDAE